jgi:4-amino-4-deoxy-L-arabinose transferase-like glycosyltransferase
VPGDRIETAVSVSEIDTGLPALTTAECGPEAESDSAPVPSGPTVTEHRATVDGGSAADPPVPLRRRQPYSDSPTVFGPTLIQIRAKYDASPLEPYDRRPRWTSRAVLLLFTATAVAWWLALDVGAWTAAGKAALSQHVSVRWFSWPILSSEPGTTELPTLSMWLSHGAAKLFGVSGATVKLPETLMAAAAVAVVYAVVKRDFGVTAGLLAGVVFSASSVSLLCLSLDHGDAAVTVLLAAAIFALLRGVEGARAWWALAALPLLIAVGLTCPGSAVQLVPTTALLTVAALGDCGIVRLLSTRAVKASMIAIVMLCWAACAPALTATDGQHRQPYDTVAADGPSITAVVLHLPLAPLIPAAVACAVLAAVLSRRADSSSRIRAQILAWGGWLIGATAVAVVCGSGEAVAALPALAALIGIGAGTLWRYRHRPSVALAMAAIAMVSAISSWLLLDAIAADARLLRWSVLLAAMAAAALLVMISLTRPHSRLCNWVGVLAAVAALAGPASYWAHLDPGPARAGGSPSTYRDAAHPASAAPADRLIRR